ncbi:MAG: PKD domain-containing protein, partial [Pseudomonas sp.]
WQCTSLQATRREGSDVYGYTFRANASLQNSRLVSADFSFGDGTTSIAVAPASGTSNTVQADHTYSAAGTYKATATLRFEATNNADAQGTDTAVTCTADVTIAAPATPAATPPVAALPAAGPASVAGLFAGTSALGALGYRWHTRRRLNKVDDFVDKLLQKR